MPGACRPGEQPQRRHQARVPARTAGKKYATGKERTPCRGSAPGRPARAGLDALLLRVRTAADATDGGSRLSEPFVRAARASDAVELARVQVACWRRGYDGIVPGDVLDAITSPEAESRWRDRWREAIETPPTSRHRVLVAAIPTEDTAAAAIRPTELAQRDEDALRDESTGYGAFVVAGFAAIGPAGDPDRWPATDAELFELRIQPELTGQGHGSRLMNAIADAVTKDRFTSLCAWVLETDTALRSFLGSAGLAADGARAELDVGVAVPMIRMRASLDPVG